MFFVFNNKEIIGYFESEPKVSTENVQYVEMGFCTNVWLFNNEIRAKQFETIKDCAVHATWKEFLGGKEPLSFYRGERLN